MPLDEKEIKEWIEKNNPDAMKLGIAAQARIWMKATAGKDITKNNIRRRTKKTDKGVTYVQATEENAPTLPEKKCEFCGCTMINFPLCGSCDIAQKGYKSIWICPVSKGITKYVNLQKKNDKTLTYKEMLGAYHKMIIEEYPDYEKDLARLDGVQCEKDVVLDEKVYI